MSKRSLSQRESDLILGLEWDKKRLINLTEVTKRLHCSSGHARKLVHTLIVKGWLEPISRGQYLMIGAARGPRGIPEMNPFIISRVINTPYFFAYRIACTHHHLLTQVPAVIHIAVTRLKRPIEIKNVRFEFIILSKKRFFGFQEAILFGEKVNISDLERTVLDALDRPELVGGIEAAAQALFQAGKRLDSSKLLNYFQKMGDSALTRRFGYLSETLRIDLNRNLRTYLEKQVKKDPAFLGTPKRWGTAGDRNGRWNLILNVPMRELMGEIRTV